MRGSGLTVQALRRHRWTLLGPACTQVVAAAVISMMVMTATSVERSPLSPAVRRSLAVRDLVEATSVFVGVSVYLSVLVVGITMNLAMGHQLRDIALLRAIGASPGQVRRSAARQAAALAVPASAVGFLLAAPAGYLWIALLRADGVVPGETRFAPHLSALPIALGVVLVTSVAGTLIAAVRTSRIRPARALTETDTGRRDVRAVRVALGLALVVAGIVLSAVLAAFAPDQAGDATLFVMLAECVGTGMLAPMVLVAVARALRPIARRGLVGVALDDLATMTKALAGALVPLVLAVAFATVKVAGHTTAAHVSGVPDPAVDRWIDYSGTAVYCVFAGVAALTCLITVSVGRRASVAAVQLAGATRSQVLAWVSLQAAVVSATALLLAAVVAGATLVPLLHAGLGVWLPWIPPALLVTGALLVVAVVVAGLVVPTAVLTKRPPVEVVRVAV